MIRYPMVVIAALFSMVSVLIVPSVGVADSTTTTDLRADLVPCCNDPEPNADGKAERKTQSKSGALKSDAFKANVELPVPSTGLGITDPATADIRLVLSRGGQDYAECFLTPDDESDNLKSVRSSGNNNDGNDDDDGNEVEFTVSIQIKVKKGTPVLTQKEGQCDVELGTSGIQPGVPDVQAGDIATASVLDSSGTTRTPFLQGTFAQH